MTDIGGAVGFLGQASFIGLVTVAASLFYIGKQLSKINESLRTNFTKNDELQ